MPALPFFLPTAGGQRFCLLHANGQASTVPIASILYIHPFAEELNRSRRMAALQCRALAEAGFEVLQIDLGGCGDSAGHFAGATWAGWVADVLAARDWLAARQQKRALASPVHTSGTTFTEGKIWLWGLRAGCLLAAEVARQLPLHLSTSRPASPANPVNLLFWQPVTQGAVHLAQFLRLKVATDLVRGGGASAKPSGGEPAPHAALKPRQMLADGQPVEIGGYEVSPALAVGLEAAHLDGLPAGSRVLCIEFSAASAVAASAAGAVGQAALSPALAGQMGKWQRHGVMAESQTVKGAHFWQALEVEVAMEAIDLTVQQLLVAQKRQGGSWQAGR